MPSVFTLPGTELARAWARQQAAALPRNDEQDSRLTALLTEFEQEMPHLPGTVAMALASHGYDAHSALATEVSKRQWLQDAQDAQKKALTQGPKGAWHEFWDATKDVTRTALAGANFPLEYLEAEFRDDPTRVGKALFTAGFGLYSPENIGKKIDQTRLGAAINVSRENPGVSVSDALNDLPEIPLDQDPNAVLEHGSKSSWLPGINSLAEQRQIRNARAASLTDGRATTMGRAAAHAVHLQPGTFWYNAFSGVIDFSKTVGLDPANVVGSPLTKAAAASKVFRGAREAVELPETMQMTARRTRMVEDSRGIARPVTDDIPVLVDAGTRQTVVYEEALRWLQTPQAGRAMEYMAAETDFNRMRRALGPNVPVSMVLRFKDESDPANIRNILVDGMSRDFIPAPISPAAADFASVGMDPLGSSRIGQAAQQVPGVGRVAARTSATFRRPNVRALADAPSDMHARRNDPNWSVEQFDRYQRLLSTGSLKATLTEERMSAHNEGLARALVDPNGDPMQAVQVVADAMHDGLLAHGVDRTTARAVTRMFVDSRQAEGAFYVNDIGNNVGHAFARVGGDDVANASPFASAEFFNDVVTFPNPKPLLEAAGRMQRINDSLRTAEREARAAGDTTRANALAVSRRAAAGGQAVGQEGIALLDAGTQLFKVAVLPARGMAWMVRNLTEEQARMAAAGLEGLFNNPVAYLAWTVGEKPNSRASRIIGRAIRPRGTGGLVDDSFKESAQLEEQATFFARSLEHGSGPWGNPKWLGTGVFGTFRRGDPEWLDGQRFTLAKLAGSEEYREIARNGPTQAVKDWFWASSVRQRMLNANNPAADTRVLATRPGSDAVIDQFAQRIQEVTGGHPHLIEAIGTGRLQGVPLTVRDSRGHVRGNPKAQRLLADYEEHLPEFTVAERTIDASRQNQGVVAGLARPLDNLFERAFYLFGSAPNNKFTRSPAFRQLYWKHVERMAELATPQARAVMVTKARANNLPRSTVARLEGIRGGGSLTVGDVNSLANERAFRETLDLFYDSHDKQNWTAALRIIQPFAAAVQDMIRVWAKLNKQNPLILHRVEQGMHAGRQEGFFWTDERGEERFTYPFSGAFNKIATGMPTPFTGTVKGANMITTGLIPGFGPGATMPASFLTPDDPKFDWVRSVILPYGADDVSGGLLESQAPSGWQKIMASLGVGSPENLRLAGSSNAQAMAYLATTGRYDLSTEEGNEALREDAKDKGRALMLIRGIAQLGLPAAPAPEWQAKDPDGRLLAARNMAADYRKFLRADPDTATLKLFSKYGDAVFYVVSGKTEGVKGATEANFDLIRNNPRLGERYPDVWSLFTDPDSPFSYDEMRRQIKEGSARPRSLADIQRAAQSNVAGAIYRQYKADVGPFPNGDQKEWLAQVKAEIRKDYPLWDPGEFDANQTPRAIAQLQKAVNDPALRGTEAAEAAGIYFDYRRQAIEAAEAGGLKGFGKARDAAPIRVWLRDVAANILADHPAFEPLWDRVLSREFETDDEVQ